ncbi:apolipoprotein N-acyltransferase, partial [Streptomyces sp. URMC 123]
MTVTAPVGEPAPAASASAARRRGPRIGVPRRLAPAGLAALAGVLLYLSFPPRPLWWLAPPALGLFALSLYGRR